MRRRSAPFAVGGGKSEPGQLIRTVENYHGRIRKPVRQGASPAFCGGPHHSTEGAGERGDAIRSDRLISRADGTTYAVISRRQTSTAAIRPRPMIALRLRAAGSSFFWAMLVIAGGRGRDGQRQDYRALGTAPGRGALREGRRCDNDDDDVRSICESRPTMTGGVGASELRRFYAHHFITRPPRRF